MDYINEYLLDNINLMQQIIIDHAVHLIENWIWNESIGVCAHNESLIKDAFQDTSLWELPLKVMQFAKLAFFE